MNNFFKITDDRFSTERTDLYDLTFEIQFSRLRFLVRSGGQLLWLEDHFLGNSNDLAACMAKCTSLIEQHAFLTTRFWKSVRLTSDLQIHTLVPLPAFDPSKAESYLMLTYPTANLSDFEVGYEPVLNQQVVTGTLRPVNRFFKDRFPGLGLISSIATGAKYFGHLPPDHTLAVISGTFIDFYYQNRKNKSLAAERTPLRNLSRIRAFTPSLVIFGEITPFSTDYRVLQEKFQTVVIGELPGEFRDIPSHRYFTLLYA